MTRCSACPGVKNCVPPDGPRNDYMFIGEAPGFEEDKKGKVFIGKTGREVNEHYLPLAGMRRDSVYITNAIKCMPISSGGKLDPKRAGDLALLESCVKHHLHGEIRTIQPKVIIAMGSFACKAIDPEINLELQHGIPLQTVWGTVFPMYHPAGGIHEPKKMLLIRTDWVRLRKYTRGVLQMPEDPYAGQEDYRYVGADEVDDELSASPKWEPMACDTETTKKRNPFCLTYSIAPGTGRLIRAEDKATLDVFQMHLNRWRGPIAFHNWIFDSRVVREMGLRFPQRRLVDTMQKVFHLGNLPQGLKALSYRQLGMVMQDFDDLVTPYAVPLVLQYYRNALAKTWAKPEEFLYRDETGQLKLKKPQSMNTKIKGFLTRYAKNPNGEVFETWDKNWEDSHEMIEAEMGEWPGKCITYAPFEKVIHYACRDADATLRLLPLIQRAVRRVRRRPEVEWMDAA